MLLFKKINVFTLHGLFAAVFLAFAMPVFSQKTSAKSSPPLPDTAIFKLFENPAALHWVKNFSGRLDDVCDVDIALGYDGKNLRGYLTYAESRLRLRLDGTLDGDELRLREVNAANETTGFFRGKYTDKRLDADWTNHNNAIGSRLETEEVNVAPIGSSHCGDNKWINRYSTAFNGANFEILLCRANNGILSGLAWIEASNLTYNLKGEIAENGDFKINLTKYDGSQQGQLTGTMKFMQSLDVAWKTPAGNQQFFNFFLKETLLMGCYEYADFTSSYDALYPKSRCNACNGSLERLVSAWVAACKANFAAKKLPPKPENRAIYRASAWPEVSLWTDELFCGAMTFTESWQDFPHGHSFNFDLKRGREITYNDLFIKNFDAKTWLADYASKEAPKLPGWNRPGFQEWLKKAGFPLFLLQREGLALRTPFEPVFGQQSILIPYSVLKPYLKKDTPVAAFVQ